MDMQNGTDRDFSLHYGQKPFKCPVLSCSYRRRGFCSVSERHTHIKHHEAPWTCDIEGCEYARTGFLSRRMRDHHLETSHKKESANRPADSTKEVTDEDEIKDRLSDLVRANKTSQVRQLLASQVALHDDTLESLCQTAAGSGSYEMMEVLLPCPEESIGSLYLSVPFFMLIHAAAKSNNVETLKYLREFVHKLKPNSQVYIATRLSDLMFVESEQVWKICADLFTSPPPCFSPALMDRLVKWSVNSSMIAATERRPEKEQRLISLWLKFKEQARYSGRQCKLSAGLVNVGKTTCSINLATVLLHHGAKITPRRTLKSPSVLEAAAGKNSLEAARFMRFLLFQGADPTKSRMRPQGERLEHDPGPSGIAQWLGIPWKELVEQAKQAIQAGQAEGKIRDP